MPGIVIEPRLVYLESRGNRFFLKISPLNKSRHMGGTSRGARQRDELYFSEDRLRGLSLPEKNKRAFIAFLLEGKFPIFKPYLHKEDFKMTKHDVGNYFLNAYEAYHPSWGKKYADKTKNITHVGSPPQNTVEVWSFFDPRDPDRKIKTFKSMGGIAANLEIARGGSIKQDFYNPVKRTHNEGILPLGIAYRTRLYYRNVPVTVLNNPRLGQDNEAASHMRQVLSSPKRDRERWMAMAVIPRISPKEIGIQLVVARNAPEAVEKLKKFYRQASSGFSNKNRTMGYYYDAWGMNDFKVVPYSGLRNYREKNQMTHLY